MLRSPHFFYFVRDHPLNFLSERIDLGFTTNANSDSCLVLVEGASPQDKPLSNDLRARLIDAVASGMSRRAAAERFGMAASTAVKWARRWGDTGVMTTVRKAAISDRIALKPMPGTFSA